MGNDVPAGEPLKADDVQHPAPAPAPVSYDLTRQSTPTPTPSPAGPNNSMCAPAPPERLQNALNYIHTLETHNTRLYQDNCRLVNSVNVLNDRLAFLDAPHNAQLVHFTDLREKLRVSDENRALIHKKYNDLLYSVAPHHHLQAELQTIRDAYTSLDNEYRFLREKYAGLKAVIGTSRATPQQLQARNLVPVVRSEMNSHTASLANPIQFPPPNQTLNNPAPLPPSLPDHNANFRRRSSEGVIVPSGRSVPPVPTTWLAPLPTPPPSASLPTSQTSPTVFPVHATVPAGSLPLPYHIPPVHDQRVVSGPPSVTQSRHSAVSEQHKPALRLPRSVNFADANDNDNDSFLRSIQTSPPMSVESDQRSSKRSISEIHPSPGAEPKKPRTEDKCDHLTIKADEASPANEILSSPASESSVSGSDVRSYQQCVNLIFEKDAEVENGVFCGLCLDRHQANMIPEPPDVLIEPDFDFLVKHCMMVHPTVWGDLRRKA